MIEISHLIDMSPLEIGTIAKVQGCLFMLLNLNTVKISRNFVDSSIRYPPPPLKCGSLTPVYLPAGCGWSSPLGAPL